MAKVVDARGLPCPQPVIATRNALRESEAVTAILDDEIARQNVTRMAERAGYRETSTRRRHLSPDYKKAPPRARIHARSRTIGGDPLVSGRQRMHQPQR